MGTHWRRYFALVAVCVVGLACLATAAQAVGSAERAIRTAAQQRRYIFVTFYKPNDSASNAMLNAVKTIQGKLANRADFVSVNVSDPANRQLVARYSINRSPIPITMVLAPNGAITAGYPRTLNANADFSSAFVSEGEADVLKVLQAGKLAVVCLQSPQTKYNSECMATANGVKADRRLGGAAVVVKMNPADPAEAKFLRKSGINPNAANAQIVVFAPSGKVVATFDGNMPQDKVMTSLLRALGGGCSGGSCGPNGCN